MAVLQDSHFYLKPVLARAGAGFYPVLSSGNIFLPPGQLKIIIYFYPY
ncbi:MAG TPA: hypothetical protein PLM81_00240 [Ginsengibacter sp.]|nr:hypothetical protein [Ginsengibacter sp.]HRP17076.1 hypothetical protein [Ginsengibacter sp.]HRP43341.1 hypothetical protein [Ginsengibacter sp.]